MTSLLSAFMLAGCTTCAATRCAPISATEITLQPSIDELVHVP